MNERRFDERLGRLLAAMVFFGVMVVWIAWEMFVIGGDADMVLQFTYPTPSNPLSWLGLVGGIYMLGLGSWRLLFARDVVVLEREQVRFGYGGRKVLPREAIAEVEKRASGIVFLRLRDDVDPATRQRAGLEHPQETWVTLAGRYRDAEQLPPAVGAWFDAR